MLCVCRNGDCLSQLDRLSIREVRKTVSVTTHTQHTSASCVAVCCSVLQCVADRLSIREVNYICPVR